MCRIIYGQKRKSMCWICVLAYKPIYNAFSSYVMIREWVIYFEKIKQTSGVGPQKKNLNKKGYNNGSIIYI